jgi:hypothetical protein
MVQLRDAQVDKSNKASHLPAEPLGGFADCPNAMDLSTPQECEPEDSYQHSHSRGYQSLPLPIMPQGSN